MNFKEFLLMQSLDKEYEKIIFYLINFVLPSFKLQFLRLIMIY